MELVYIDVEFNEEEAEDVTEFMKRINKRKNNF